MIKDFPLQLQRVLFSREYVKVRVPLTHYTCFYDNENYLKGYWDKGFIIEVSK